MSEIEIECKEGYKASRWQKENRDRIYIDGPQGTLGYFDLSSGSKTQGTFVVARDAQVSFGPVDDEDKTQVTLKTPGGHTVTLGSTARTDQHGAVLTREAQITLGMCMNVASRLLPNIDDLSGVDDEHVANRVVELAQTIYDRYL